MALAAQIKSVSCAYFLENASTVTGKLAVAAPGVAVSRELRKPRREPILGQDLRFKLLIYMNKSEGEKVGVSNKPGSVIDNHSSGTAVTDCLKRPTRESVRHRRCGP